MDSLPDELLDWIISEAGKQNSSSRSTEITCWPALRNLSLVSRRMHRITEPHLYQSIKIDLSEPYEIILPGRPLIRRSSAAILRLLRSRQSLARCVKCVTITNSLSKLEPGHRKCRADEDRLDDLIRMLPNIECLDVSRYVTSDKSIQWLMTTNPVGPHRDHLFSNLSYLAIDMGIESLANLHPISRLPKLSSLHIRNGIGSVSDEALSNWKHVEKSNIKHLSILGMDIIGTHRALKLIARICVSLESLTFQRPRAYVWGTFCNLLQYFEQPLRKSLRKLDTIDARFGGPVEIDILQEALCLEDVRAGSDCFAIPDCDTSMYSATTMRLKLPRSIRTFYLDVNGSRWSDLNGGLIRLREEIPIRLPHLRKVTLEMKEAFDYDWQKHACFVRRFQQAYSEVDVTFTVLMSEGAGFLTWYKNEIPSKKQPHTSSSSEHKERLTQSMLTDYLSSGS